MTDLAFLSFFKVLVRFNGDNVWEVTSFTSGSIPRAIRELILSRSARTWSRVYNWRRLLSRALLTLVMLLRFLSNYVVRIGSASSNCLFVASSPSACSFLLFSSNSLWVRGPIVELRPVCYYSALFADVASFPNMIEPDCCFTLMWCARPWSSSLNSSLRSFLLLFTLSRITVPALSSPSVN